MKTIINETDNHVAVYRKKLSFHEAEMTKHKNPFSAKAAYHGNRVEALRALVRALEYYRCMEG